MSNFTDMKCILDNQVERGVKSGDGSELIYEIEKDHDGSITLDLLCLEIGFVFSPKGRLIRAYNYKQ